MIKHYNAKGNLAPRATLTLDTAEEVSIYDADGVLQRFAEDCLVGGEQ